MAVRLDRISFPARIGFSWLLFVVFMSVFSMVDVDFKVADIIYALEDHRWSLQSSFIAQDVIHQGGKTLSLFLGIAALCLLSISVLRTEWRNIRRPMLYLFLATLLSTLAVSVLKHTISMECPWDLSRYGGAANFVGLLDKRPASMAASACFPAGHASAGYAWISLYFFFAAIKPEWRWKGLAFGLAMGGIFGVGQQLRGAHFLSHDLWTVMICWTVSFAMAHVMLTGSALGHKYQPTGHAL